MILRTGRECGSPFLCPGAPITVRDALPGNLGFFFWKRIHTGDEEEILDAAAPGYIAGLSLLGGEPFEPSSQEVLTGLLRKFKERFPQKTVWCYTGYLFDKELLEESRARCAFTDEMLSMIDVLVDGRFVEAKKDITLLFRGSSNQRLINVPESLKRKEVVLYEPGV